MDDQAENIVRIVDAAEPPEVTVAPAAPVDTVDEAKPKRRRRAAPPADVDVAFEQSSQTGASGGDGADGGGSPEADELNRRLAFLPQTDLGNAERFVARQKGKFVWCRALGWLWWDGRRWARAGAEERVRIAEHETVRAIQDEARALLGDANAADGAERKEKLERLAGALAKWGRRSESAGRLAAIASGRDGGRAGPYMAVAPELLDADPFRINVRNGTLVLRRRVADGEDCVALVPHDPADMITKLADVAYEPAAACPQYDAFFARVQPKPEMRRFLHAWLGYSASGDASEQKLAVFWGKGRNGKSTFIDLMAHVLGDYSETVPIETFLAEGRGRNAGQATPDLAILPGVRFLRTSEPDKGAKLAEALIKLATGGEPIQARHLNRDYFKFYPIFKLTISGNYRPSIVGADEGIWRRVQLVPWPVTLAVEEIDRDLGTKLRGEASGILNRVLDGVRDWLERGLVMPDDVAEATADYRRDSDPLGRFLDACVQPDAGGRVQASVLHAVFNAWAKANSAAEWSAKGLASALKERGVESRHSDVNWWLNIRLTKVVADFVDAEGRPLARGTGDAVRLDAVSQGGEEAVPW